jgi:hypothetical protein
MNLKKEIETKTSVDDKSLFNTELEAIDEQINKIKNGRQQAHVLLVKHIQETYPTYKRSQLNEEFCKKVVFIALYNAALDYYRKVVLMNTGDERKKTQENLKNTFTGIIYFDDQDKFLPSTIDDINDKIKYWTLAELSGVTQTTIFRAYTRVGTSDEEEFINQRLHEAAQYIKAQQTLTQPNSYYLYYNGIHSISEAKSNTILPFEFKNEGVFSKAEFKWNLTLDKTVKDNLDRIMEQKEIQRIKGKISETDSVTNIDTIKENIINLTKRFNDYKQNLRIEYLNYKSKLQTFKASAQLQNQKINDIKLSTFSTEKDKQELASYKKGYQDFNKTLNDIEEIIKKLTLNESNITKNGINTFKSELEKVDKKNLELNEMPIEVFIKRQEELKVTEEEMRKLRAQEKQMRKEKEERERKERELAAQKLQEEMRKNKEMEELKMQKEKEEKERKEEKQPITQQALQNQLLQATPSATSSQGFVRPAKPNYKPPAPASTSKPKPPSPIMSDEQSAAIYFMQTILDSVKKEHPYWHTYWYGREKFKALHYIFDEVNNGEVMSNDILRNHLNAFLIICMQRRSPIPSFFGSSKTMTGRKALDLLNDLGLDKLRNLVKGKPLKDRSGKIATIFFDYKDLVEIINQSEDAKKLAINTYIKSNIKMESDDLTVMHLSKKPK